jgi:hypothetical protein
MLTKALKEVIERAETRPREDQDALAEIARHIEARRSGIYRMTDEERSAVREGRDQASRREFISDDDMRAFWKQLSNRMASCDSERARPRAL